MRKSATLFLVILTACSTISPQAVSSAMTVTPEATITPAPSPTATSTPIPSPTSTPQVSYLDILDITQTDSIANVIYLGVHINATIGVDASANRWRVHSIEVPDSRLANIGMRAWWNIIEPENEGDTAGLVDFAKKWENVQKGLLPCGDLAATFEAFEVGGGPKQKMTVVPYCGVSSIPDGTIQLSEVEIVYVSLYKTGPNGAVIMNPSTPWMDQITPSGQAAGLLIDRERGRLILFAQSGSLVVQRIIVSYVASSIELMLDYLRHFVEGKDWSLRRTQLYADRGDRWEGEIQVK